MNPFRKFITFAVAAFFMLAAQPGTMAMGNVGAASTEMAAMANGHHGEMPCRHAVPPTDKKSPCKNMAVCLGMLSCYGITALGTAPVLPQCISVRSAIPSSFDFAPGITHRPDNPPPIA